MASAKRTDRVKHPITLRLTQDEADLIRSVFGDLTFTGDKMPTERMIVSDIFGALVDVTDTSRRYDLELSGAGSSLHRRSNWARNTPQ